MITLRSALLLFTCFCSTALFADEIFVITHQQSSITKLTPKLIENIFLKKTLLNDAGNTWIPLNLDPNHPIRIAFSLALFKKKTRGVGSLLERAIFSGHYTSLCRGFRRRHASLCQYHPKCHRLRVTLPYY